MTNQKIQQPPISFEEARYRLAKGRKEAAKALWIQERVKELVPKWYWNILQKTGSSFLAKLMGIVVGENLIADTVSVWRWGKLKFEKSFAEPESNIVKLN
jgi:hypothetical protein